MKRKIISFLCLLLSIFFISSCGNNETNNGNKNGNNQEEEVLNDIHHVHLVDESKTIHHDANCLHDEFDEYFCECGKRIYYSEMGMYLDTNIHHDFVNGVCKECGYEESPYEIELITPTTCRIIMSSIEEDADIVIPDTIYGLDVVEVKGNGFQAPKKLNSFTFGKNIKRINTNLMYSKIEYNENLGYDEIKYYYTEIGEFNYTSTIYDFVNTEFMSSSSNPLFGANKATINGEDIKNLVLPDDIDLTNSINTFGGKYIESITLPDNLSTMGKNTFNFSTMNDSVLNYDNYGVSYLKSKSNDKYMLAKFDVNSDRDNIVIDSNVKMIYGPAWLTCNCDRVIINDNVKYFTDIVNEMDIRVIEESGDRNYSVFNGEIVYTGTLNNWFNKEFLRYRNVDFSDRYMSTSEYLGDILDYHNPVALALKFTCGNTILKESSNGLHYVAKDITLSIPSGIEKINNFALEGCEFTNIYIPKSLKKIGTKSIGMLTGRPIRIDENYNKVFSALHYEGSLLEWLDIDFDSYLANPFVNDNDPTSWDNEFYINNDELVYDLVIPEGVEEIKKAQFAGIGSIVSITFPSTLKYIDDFAFSRCQNIYTGYGIGGFSSIVSRLLDYKNNKDLENHNEYHYLEDANFDLEKLSESLPNKKFDIIIPKNVKYIGMCAFETRGGGINIYIPKEVTYVSTYAMCVGRTDYIGIQVLPAYLYTDRDNAEDSKWSFLREINYGEVLGEAGITLDYYAYASVVNCNVDMDDILVNNYSYYKKVDNSSVSVIRIVGTDYGIYNVYTSGNSEPIGQDAFDENNMIKGIEVDGKKYKVILDDYYILSINVPSIYRRSIYITKDVKEIDFGDVAINSLYGVNYYFEGTEEEWNNICKNENIKPKAYNCTLSLRTN